MLFLVEGNVTRTNYMSSINQERALRLVEANDEVEAKTKFEGHFNSQSDPEGVTIYAEASIISGVIS